MSFITHNCAFLASIAAGAPPSGSSPGLDGDLGGGAFPQEPTFPEGGDDAGFKWDTPGGDSGSGGLPDKGGAADEGGLLSSLWSFIKAVFGGD